MGLEIFKRRILLMTVSGIPVRADYRWFFVLVLMSVITASSLTVSADSFPAALLFGFLTTLIFFACVLVHEMAHAFTARMEGVQVVEIVLHPFGGLARLRHEPETPRAEFRIAIAGPAASFLLAVLFVLLMAVANGAGIDAFARIFFLLFLFNFLLAVFNLFPGYPLDGGRILRAYLWRSGKDLNEATTLTGKCGQMIGVVLILSGLLIAIVKMEFFTGFWTTLVGLFLYDSAKGIVEEVRSAEHLPVANIMQLPVPVEPEMDLMSFVDNVLPAHRRPVFPVARNKEFFGMLLLDDLKAIPREEWRKTLIRSVMRAVTAEQFVDANSMLSEARQMMRTNGIGAVAVVDSEGRVVGCLGGVGIKKAR
ncbi:MAG: M50 family metallopeptidase [Candidatus Binatia bacterium]